MESGLPSPAPGAPPSLAAGRAKPWAREAKTADCRRQRIKRMESGLPSPALGAPPSLAAEGLADVQPAGKDAGAPAAGTSCYGARTV